MTADATFTLPFSLIFYFDTFHRFDCILQYFNDWYARRPSMCQWLWCVWGLFCERLLFLYTCSPAHSTKPTTQTSRLQYNQKSSPSKYFFSFIRNVNESFLLLALKHVCFASPLFSAFFLTFFLNNLAKCSPHNLFMFIIFSVDFIQFVLIKFTVRIHFTLFDKICNANGQVKNVCKQNNNSFYKGINLINKIKYENFNFKFPRIFLGK